MYFPFTYSSVGVDAVCSQYLFSTSLVTRLDFPVLLGCVATFWQMGCEQKQHVQWTVTLKETGLVFTSPFHLPDG